jgi:hypothetical protein
MKRLILCCFLATITTNACAQECTVDDPTGTPLNIRERPNGRIIGALYNGVTVYVRDLTIDAASGQRWAYIIPLNTGKSGWVFRPYLDCK